MKEPIIEEYEVLTSIENWDEVSITHKLISKKYLKWLMQKFEQLPFASKVYYAGNGVLRICLICNEKGLIPVFSKNIPDDICIFPHKGYCTIMRNEEQGYYGMEQQVIDIICGTLCEWKVKKKSRKEGKMKILLCGKSSSGKDFCRDYLISKYKLNPIISHTSRPIREGETQGKEYYFVSYNDFLEMDYMNEFVETRSYSTLVNNKAEVWNYGTTYVELLKDNFVGIKCLVGAKAIKKAYPETIVIHIHIDDSIREARAKLRGSFDETEWNRRKQADDLDFPEKEITKVCDYFITNNLGEVELKQSLDELIYILLEGESK